MGSRNYGVGSRDMARAGRMALAAAREQKDIGHQTVETNAGRWARFVAHVREQGVRRMEHITREHVRAYAASLRDAGQSAKSQQNAVSAINSVMRAAAGDRWQTVRPVADAGCDRATEVRTHAPAMTDRTAWAEAREAVREAHGERAAAVTELARELGLRAKEASLGSPRAWAQQLQRGGEIKIEKGTKGGRPRDLAITRASQRDAIERAAAVQGRSKSMIPRGQTWAAWKQDDQGLRGVAETLRPVTGESRPLHSLRASYACERYAALTGRAAPVVAGAREADRATDREAREVIARELGHGRTDVAAAYVGGAR